MANYFKDFAVAAVTLFIRECVPQLVRAYHKRYTEPKKADRQVFLDQASWFSERADKLAAFHFQLGREPIPDKFKLAGLVSKLDPQDREWAMKQTDIKLLRGGRCRESYRVPR